MQPSTLNSQIVRFGPFEVDLRAGELRQEGKRIKIQEQPFQILAVLLEQPGNLVTREELCKRIWPAGTFVDFEHSLNKAMNKLRCALADAPDAPAFIETVPKRGYRFIAKVEQKHSNTVADITRIDSIVVFQLASQNSDPDLRCLAVGIPGNVIHSLSQIPGLCVIAWNRPSSHSAPDGEDPIAVGRTIGARTALTGDIWQHGSKLRVHVNLLDTANGRALWGEQYDGDLNELFTIQDQISHKVSQHLRRQLVAAPEEFTAKHYTENIDAYQLYVRARHWCEKRSAEGFQHAVEYLNRAIQLDPSYALAHAELAQCISVPCYYGMVDPHIAYPKAKNCALRALELDPDLPEAHEVLATILKNYEWNWQAAEEQYKLAIKLNPNYATAHYHYSYLLGEQGRFDEAIREATEAISRDPMSGLLNAGLAFVLLHARLLDRCIEQAFTTIEVDPGMTLSYWTLGTAYEQKDDYVHALEAYRKSLELGGGIGFSKAFIARVLARNHESAKAREQVQEMHELALNRYIPHLAFVIAYAGMQEIDLALDFLEKSWALRETNLILIKVWPHFDPLRGHPRFQSIERRIGLRPPHG